MWLHVISYAELRGSDKINIYFKKGGAGGGLGKLNYNCLGDSMYFSVLHFPVLTKVSELFGIYWNGISVLYYKEEKKKIGKKWKLLSL